MNPLSKIIGALLLVMMISENSISADGVLRIAFPVNQLQLDPQRIEDMYSTTIVNQIYGRLFKYTPEGQVRPDLVDRWEVSKDKMEYTFYLKTFNFSDGTPIRAQHVVNSLKRIFKLKAALASDLAMIKGATEFNRTNNPDELKIFAVDSNTVKISTVSPTSLLIYLLAVPDVGILKLEKVDEKLEFKTNMAFSGPYKISEISPDRIVVQKWRPSDLDSSQPPKQIEFNLYDKVEGSKLLMGFFTDTSTFMTFDQNSNPFENRTDWRPVASEATNERFIVMNPKKVPLNIRNWMASKVNSEEFVKSLADKSIVPAFGFIPNGLPGNLKKAKSFKTLNLKIDKPFKVKIIHGANLPYPEKFKDYLTRVWKHPKLQLEFESLPIATYLDILFKGEGQVVIGARGLEYPEGYSIVTYFRSNLKSNYFFVNNPAIDDLIDKAFKETLDEKRYKIYEEIQEMVLEEATVIPLAFGSWKKHFWSNRIKEVPPHPIGIHFMPFEMISMGER